jgi:hypothetical protein
MLTRLLAIVPLLLCPLLMVVCMWAMRGMGNRTNPQGQIHTGHHEIPAAARVAQLERELADFRQRLLEADSPTQHPSKPQPGRPNEVRPSTPVQPS